MTHLPNFRRLVPAFSCVKWGEYKLDCGVLQTHAAELPRGRACPVCSQLNRAGQRGGSGSSVPRPAVCVRASSHISSNNGKKEVSTTTTKKAMRGPWTCGVRSKQEGRKWEEREGRQKSRTSFDGQRIYTGWGTTSSKPPHSDKRFSEDFFFSHFIGTLRCNEK